MKVVLAYIPELINFSGLTIGLTNLYNHTIISNSGVKQNLINISGELYYSNLTEDYTGVYNVDLFHGSGYIGQGTVKLDNASGYYIIDDPFYDAIDFSDVSLYPIETGNNQFNQQYASKSQIDSLQIKVNQIIEKLQ